MPSNYVRGRMFEYTVRNKLAKHGYLSIRASSSKGTPKFQPPIDIVAIKNGEIILVECKRSKRGIRKELITTLKKMGEEYSVNTIIVYSNRGIRCILVHDHSKIEPKLKTIFKEVQTAERYEEKRKGREKRKN